MLDINKIKIKTQKAEDKWLKLNYSIGWKAYARWRELLDIAEKSQVYNDFLGESYKYQKFNRLHLLNNWVIPDKINNEDICLTWIAHINLKDVNGCQVTMFDGWESKIKKSRVNKIKNLLLKV